MGIAESMKGLTEDILGSYDARVKALGDIVADTHRLVADTRKTVKGFASDRKKMADKQADSLSGFAKDLFTNVDDLLKEFNKERKEMSKEQAKGLSDFAKNLAKDVSSMVKGFQKARSQMSEELKDKLNGEIKEVQLRVKNIIDNTQTLIGEYCLDFSKARKSWSGMSDSLAKAREKGVSPRFEGGEKVMTLNDDVEKKSKKKAVKVKD